MVNRLHYKVGCDAHKCFSLFSVLDLHADVVQRTRIDHQLRAIQALLSQFPAATPLALETVGN